MVASIELIFIRDRQITPGPRFLFESQDKNIELLILTKTWGEAYLHGKTTEFRFHTPKWLLARLGTVARFQWSYGQDKMTFLYPSSDMTEEYGYFESVENFWDKFDGDEDWASGFYSTGGHKGPGREEFKTFVLQDSQNHKDSKCLWFRPQKLTQVGHTNTPSPFPSYAIPHP